MAHLLHWEKTLTHPGLRWTTALASEGLSSLAACFGAQAAAAAFPVLGLSLPVLAGSGSFEHSVANAVNAHPSASWQVEENVFLNSVVERARGSRSQRALALLKLGTCVFVVKLQLSFRAGATLYPPEFRLVFSATNGLSTQKPVLARTRSSAEN